MNTSPEIALFIGRLHVLLVHLPIALIVLLAVLEWFARSPRFRNANVNAGLILALGVPAAVFAAVCGWLLSLAGGYDQRLLQLHKWTGIATAAMFLVAALLYRLDLKKPYRWSLFSSVAVLLFASHFGGSLTHGSDYLVRYAPGPFRNWLGRGEPANQIAQAQPLEPLKTEAFTGLVQPIFQHNCASCHGPEKSKGGLRLDTWEAMLQGGDSGPGIVPGKSTGSLVIKRVLLPLSSDDHMPPEGKPQPSPDDLALLQWWIDAGAPTNRTVAELKPPPNITRVVESRLGKSTAAVAQQVAPSPLPFDRALPVASKLAEDLQIVVSPLAHGEPWLMCNASVAGTNFGDAQLSELAPLRLNLKWLNLAGTAVTDQSLLEISAMTNLTRLHLERTKISDEGLRSLASLPELEYLNLYSTRISDSGLESLQKLPKLKQLYLWQTEVTQEAATNFAVARIDTDQIARWQEEIEQLKRKISETRFTLDLGAKIASATNTTELAATSAAPNNSAASVPVNTVCPVSGKPVDSSKSVTHDGKLIAFCCEDCKSKFQQDPKTYAEKILAKPEKQEAELPKGSR